MYVVLVFLFLASPSCGVPLEQLYRWGEQAGDRVLLRNLDDTGSQELPLTVPITFYGKTYHSVFINANGLLSFRTDIAPFLNMPFPLDYPSIAPFYSDVDTRGSGSVYYRESKETDLLQRMEDAIVQHFSSVTTFSPLSLLIVTWHEVGYFEEQIDKVNTFQAVIGSSSEDSFCLLLYVDGGIQWIQGQGKADHQADAGAQAGFMSENGQLYTLRGSGTDQMFNIDKWSNIDEPGAYLFRIGETGELDNVVPPDTRTYEVSASTCSAGASTCHSKALCFEFTPGFCCQCDKGYYGNGISCLLDGEPKRVNGKVNGVINGESIDNEDYHAYVVTSDGRAYTAVSKIPPHIGYDMQSISPLATSIAWMFASMKTDTKNGFQLSGGLLNRTVNMAFPQTGHSVSIQQQFLGSDVFNDLRINTTFQGDIPTIPITKEIEIADYEQIFHRVKPGEYRSELSLEYRLKGNEITTPFNVEESFTYVPCAYAPYNYDPEMIRVQIARNFIVYNSEEEIVRYAMTSKVVSLTDTNPCEEGEHQCDENSKCVPNGDTYRCDCNEGYDRLYTDASTSSCVDINECNERRHNCHINAICHNLEGNYMCECDHGYSGDGVHCTRHITCSDLNCDVNAYCTQASEGNPQCMCNEGYAGDGYVCRPQTDTGACTELCSPNGYCQYDVVTSTYVCLCNSGFHGDGHSCEAILPATPEPDCGYFGISCSCPEGWIYNSTLDECLAEEFPNECATPKDCPPNAECKFNPDSSKFECSCAPGFSLSQDSCVEVPEVVPLEPCGGLCSYDGKCDFNYVLQEEKCVCLPGYKGDGFICEEDIPPEPDCIIQYCSCPEGWRHESLNGSRCVRDDIHTVSCNERNECHPNAQCEYDHLRDRYICVCTAGYEGNGYMCIRTNESCRNLDVCSLNGNCIIDSETNEPLCICNPGYHGDGIICDPIVTQDECATPADCPPNAECKFNPDSSRFECSCAPGFSLSQDSCVEVPEAGCDILKNCHPHATCNSNIWGTSYSCECNDGYDGNGYFCEPQDCSVINNCGQDADCVYEEVSFQHQCQCRDGYEGDGYICNTARTCAEDISLCDRNAVCVEKRGRYYCVCVRGYTGDGSSCDELPKLEGNVLFVSKGISILKIPFNPTPSNPGRPIIISPLQTAVGMDIHCQTGRLYWADVTGGVIRSSDFNGANRDPLVIEDVESPEDVSVDWLSGNLYWTDSGKDTIEVININSGFRTVLIDEDLKNPRGIAVHPGMGKFYWTDWDRDEPKIEEASMDGTNRRDLIVDNLGLPNSLTIDFQTDELCWADAGSKLIECYSFRQYRRREISPASYPFGLTNSEDKFFWTDWDEKTVVTIDKRYQENVEKLQIPLGGSSRYYDIVAVPTECPQVSNSCEYGNGGCGEYELCLPNNVGRHTCMCASNLNANQTCA